MKENEKLGGHGVPATSRTHADVKFLRRFAALMAQGFS